MTCYDNLNKKHVIMLNIMYLDNVAWKRLPPFPNERRPIIHFGSLFESLAKRLRLVSYEHLE